MENITHNPYFFKIFFTIVAVVIKLAIDSITKKDEEANGLLKLFSVFAFYILPITIVVWLNLDQDVQNTKLNTTLIALNIGLFIFNYLQSRITENYKIVEQLSKTEFDKVEQVKQINSVQVEKIKAINEKQKYILNELSKINDRIIGYFKDKAEK